MRVVNVTLPVLVAALLVGLNSAAWAGPASSALDPYAYIQAPTKEEREAMLAKKRKKNKEAKEVATGHGGHSVNTQQGIAGPIDVVLDGVKESTAGLGKHIASGTAGVFTGTKKLGSKLASGLTLGKDKEKSPKPTKVAKAAESKPEVAQPKEHKTTETVAAKPVEKTPEPAKKKSGSSPIAKLGGVNKVVADSFKTAGGAVKSGTVTVAKGFKTAGGKIVDGTQAAGGKLASLPKAIHLPGKKSKKEQSVVAAKPAATAQKEAPSSVAPPTETANTAAVDTTVDPVASGLRPEKTTPVSSAKAESKNKVGTSGSKDNSGALANAAKRLVSAPKAGISVIGHSFGKLNPFHKESKSPSPAATAAKTGTIPQ